MIYYYLALFEIFAFFVKKYHKCLFGISNIVFEVLDIHWEYLKFYCFFFNSFVFGVLYRIFVTYHQIYFVLQIFCVIFIIHISFDVFYIFLFYVPRYYCHIQTFLGVFSIFVYFVTQTNFFNTSNFLLDYILLYIYIFVNNRQISSLSCPKNFSIIFFFKICFFIKSTIIHHQITFLKSDFLECNYLFKFFKFYDI